MCIAPTAARGPLREPDAAVRVADGTEMPLWLAGPGDGTSPRGVVLLLTDIVGWGTFPDRFSAKLGAEGYAVVVPDLFFRVGALAEPSMEAALERRARLDDAGLLDDLRQVIDWLGGKVGTAPAGLAAAAEGGVVTLGFCVGGTLSMQLAAGATRGAVVYYGFPNGDGTPSSAPTPLEMAERIRGPLLGFWGGSDHHITIADVEALDDALTRLGTPHDFTVYDAAEHNFMAALVRSAGPSEIALQAWESTRRFLADRLGDRPQAR